MKNKISNIKNKKFIINKPKHLLLVTSYWLLVTIFIGGCATIYNPATQKKELILIDTQAEVLLGRNMDVQVAQSFEVIKDAGPSERVNKIGRDIALVADRQDLKYIFKIVKDKEVNAFSTPGGFVYINTGLLDRVDDNELACVLAHEVGHIAARHIVKKLQTQIGYDILMSLAFGKGGAEEVQKAIS
ncbi:MAG: M48 family metalloprotease, partial [Candidatus Omnitrophica bacterium]|nr:M48 family metalloprotease [Candidatus Omnitrophota bacterium]